jgi:hypothetical protein
MKNTPRTLGVNQDDLNKINVCSCIVLGHLPIKNLYTISKLCILECIGILLHFPIRISKNIPILIIVTMHTRKSGSLRCLYLPS